MHESMEAQRGAAAAAAHVDAGPLSPRLQAWRAGGELVDWRGHRIFVATAGRGPALLLIHGYPTGSFDWQPLWSALTARYTVIAADMLGLGFSDKPAGHCYGLDAHADLQEHLVQRAGWSSFHVAAHDLGVSVTQELLARRREDRRLPRIESTVLLNGGLCPEAYAPRPIQRLLASPLGPWIGPRLPRRAVERAIARLFGPEHPPSPALLEDFWHLLSYKDGRRVTHAVGRFFVERMARRDRLVAAVLDPKARIRLINGAADPNSGRAMAEHWRALRPDADIVSLTGCGHWPQFEDAPGVLRAMLEFFADATNSPDTATRPYQHDS